MTDPAERDRIRLLLARRWLVVKEYDLAEKAVRAALDGPRGVEAAEILQKLEEARSAP